MDISFVPSLQHMCCVKIVTSLLNTPDILQNHRMLKEFFEIKSKISEDISKLIPSKILQEKLESFIMPLLYQIENWSVFSERRVNHWRQNNCRLSLSDLTLVWGTIPQCWQHDGTLDREKLMNVLVRNANVKPLLRFEMSCLFCIFEDIAHFWNDLYGSEKAYLLNQCTINPDMSFVIIRPWIEWLQSSDTNKVWESFAKSALETPLCNNSVYILKHVLQTLSPAEKGQYLVRVLTGNDTSTDVMRFGLPMLTPDERETVFRESTCTVFRCILCWPLISVFSDIAEKLWPYITTAKFCEFLYIILRKIRDEEKNFIELILTLKSFWELSPAHYKEFAQNDNHLCRPLYVVLEYDFSEEFPREGFLHECHNYMDVYYS